MNAQPAQTDFKTRLQLVLTELQIRKSTLARAFY